MKDNGNRINYMVREHIPGRTGESTTGTMLTTKRVALEHITGPMEEFMKATGLKASNMGKENWLTVRELPELEFGTKVQLFSGSQIKKMTKQKDIV